jgi:uncharacterized protein DUF6268
MSPWRQLVALALFTLALAVVPPAGLAQTAPAPPPSPDPAVTLPERQEEMLPPVSPLPEEGREDKPPAADSAVPPAGGFSPFTNPAGGFSPLFSPTVGHTPFRADYRVIWWPEEPVAGQPTRLGYEQQDFSVSFPLWQNATDEWSASAHVRSEIFQTQAILPDTRQPFPDDLWNIRFGTTYRHLFDNGWTGGATVSVGSASDRPFAGIDEMTAGVNAFLRVPQGEHNAWLFSLSYSSNSQLPIPIPGVAYVWQPSDCFRANIGLPLLIMYRPWDDLTLDFSYMLLTTVHARATYRLCAPLRVYAAYDWENESYLPVDRPNQDDRLFYYDQRLTAGLLFFLNGHLSFDLSGGYVFDRFYFEGRQLSDSHQNRIDVGNGPFVSFQSQLRW